MYIVIYYYFIFDIDNIRLVYVVVFTVSCSVTVSAVYGALLVVNFLAFINFFCNMKSVSV